MRPLIRRLLVAVIRRTRPAPISKREHIAQAHALADTLNEEIWESMRVTVVS